MAKRRDNKVIAKQDSFNKMMRSVREQQSRQMEKDIKRGIARVNKVYGRKVMS